MMPLPIIKEQSASKIRYLTLNDNMDKYGREFMLLDNKQWDAPITENPKLGSTEMWYVNNLTDDSHPIHIHLIDFQIVDRRDFDVEKYRSYPLHGSGDASRTTRTRKEGYSKSES